MQGLSIANNLLADRVQYNLDANQSALTRDVRQLSSGLRINSAADDPSGLAIATNLQTQVDAFQQASQNVQDANNAAQVADGALATETSILQRMRNLAVEAASSVNSSSDLQNIQSEISQLITEVNRISQNTNFNGAPLLDGSHSGYQAYVNASYTVSNAVLTSATSSAGSVGSGVQDGDFSSPSVAPGTFGVPPTGWTVTGGGAVYDGNDGTDIALANGQQALAYHSPGSISQVVTGLTAGASYQLSYSAGLPSGHVGGQLNVTVNGSSASPTLSVGFQTYTLNFTADASGQATITFTNPPSQIVDLTNISIVAVSSSGTGSSGDLVAGVAQSALFNTTGAGAAVDGTVELQVVNSGSSASIQVSFLDSATGTQTVVATNAAANSLVSVDGLNITLGNATLADSGTTAYIKVNQAVAASSGTNALTIQSGADEGDTVQLGMQATNAQTLRISNINVANAAAPVLAAEDAIGQIDNALTTLLSQRAQLGAVIVRLNEDANNDNVAATNLQSSESSIRDLNVGEATTDFTKHQVLGQIGTSVLAQSNSNANSILGLFR